MSQDLGSTICTFTIKLHNLEVPIIFVAWRGRSSFRPFVSHSSRKFYLSLLNIDHSTINDIIEKLTIEEKASNEPRIEGKTNNEPKIEDS
ncbi:unnamed protein product [Adineta steineri]|nr:unnamed protein product [Adineta steineri]